MLASTVFLSAFSFFFVQVCLQAPSSSSTRTTATKAVVYGFLEQAWRELQCPHRRFRDPVSEPSITTILVVLARQLTTGLPAVGAQPSDHPTSLDLLDLGVVAQVCKSILPFSPAPQRPAGGWPPGPPKLSFSVTHVEVRTCRSRIKNVLWLALESATFPLGLNDKALLTLPTAGLPGCRVFHRSTTGWALSERAEWVSQGLVCATDRIAVLLPSDADNEAEAGDLPPSGFPPDSTACSYSSRFGSIRSAGLVWLLRSRGVHGRQLHVIGSTVIEWSILCRCSLGKRARSKDSAVGAFVVLASPNCVGNTRLEGGRKRIDDENLNFDRELSDHN
ncbi:hypothetical protein VTI74DRAFT_3345 [Chaetomium olivicolor]